MAAYPLFGMLIGRLLRVGRTGDILIQLDETLVKAILMIYENRLREALARRARLIAERDGQQ